MMSLDGQQSAAHPSEQASKQNSNKYEFFLLLLQMFAWQLELMPVA